MQLQAASLLDAAREVLVLLAFRTLPVFGAALASRAIGLRSKLVLTLFAIAVVPQIEHELPLWWLAAAYAYYAAATCALPQATRALRSQALTRGGLFAACACVYLLIPGVGVPAVAKAGVLILGWDFMLASYSYVVESARLEPAPGLRTCLFFVLVNPALVFTERGKQVSEPAIDGRGLLRAALGLGALFVATAVLAPASTAVRAHAFGLPFWLEPLIGAVVYGGLRFLVEYFRHSGLASLQIGLLRQLGYELPERYRWPIAARDPLDFWRRWNTYVGGFMHRYVFRPLVVAAADAAGRRRAKLAAAAGALGTFVLVGVLHDAYVYALGSAGVGRGVLAFSAIGATAVAWLACSRLLRRAPAAGLTAQAGSRALLWLLIAGFAAWGFG